MKGTINTYVQADEAVKLEAEERKRVLQMHRDNGFDLTNYDPLDETYVMRCSKCAVAIINDAACHEHGCPNKSRRKT